QFALDVFGGRPLDWSFSPQVFVFPEIPISLTAYLLAGGTIQAYYLVVAILNSALLFLALVSVIRYLYSGESLRRRLARAAVAMFPLLLLPLLGTTWLFEYQFAPTYYFGMYLMILLAPLLFLGCTRPVKVVVGVGIVLTAASNPLALVFTVPALACVFIVLGAASGFRTVLRPAVGAAGIVALALLIRFVFFGRLQGASPFAYMSTSIFSGRLQAVVSYVASLLGDPMSAVVVLLGTVFALTGLAVAVIFSVRIIRHRPQDRTVPAVALYYGLVPIAGLAGTLALIITDYLYLWPVVILPLVLVLLPLPRHWVPWAAAIAAVALLVTGAVTGAADNLGRVSDYFSYRSAETQCLDSRLPAGMTVGYSTFSDARRIELTSHRGVRLIQLKSSGVRAYWLTNRDYARDSVGSFFYINSRGDEPPISVSYLESHFGQPDSSFTCGPGETVLIYTQPAKLAKIKARYAILPAP
ncbi:MAG TPA: hypothetical protein VHU90_01825, partial [Galbitalea sp.]|nr:hypothetical protein [Galbitalea sp.]